MKKTIEELYREAIRTRNDFSFTRLQLKMFHQNNYNYNNF